MERTTEAGLGFRDPGGLKDAFIAEKYLLPDQAATVLYLAVMMNKPVLVEGPAGVGKTDLSQVMARVLGRALIRLQCYEGLDESKALYEWQYGKQLLYGQILKDKIAEVVAAQSSLADAMDHICAFEDVFFSRRFLQPRPLLKAISSASPVVLLVDEVDKSDPELEAMLLEILSDFSVSIPEIGTVRAVSVPVVILTSNNSREMSDALKRRCLHLFLDFPAPEIELEILKLKVPKLSAHVAAQVVAVVAELRKLPLKKIPSISETLDWAAALVALSVDYLSDDVLNDTLGVIVKYERDLVHITRNRPAISRAMV